jgi:hypothetical protein
MTKDEKNEVKFLLLKLFYQDRDPIGEKYNYLGEFNFLVKNLTMYTGTGALRSLYTSYGWNTFLESFPDSNCNNYVHLRDTNIAFCIHLIYCYKILKENQTTYGISLRQNFNRVGRMIEDLQELKYDVQSHIQIKDRFIKCILNSIKDSKVSENKKISLYDAIEKQNNNQT